MELNMHDFLAQGIIHSSYSSYAIPALLMKDDQSWPLYHSLDKIMVLDYFPISIVDELLEELHRAKKFSILSIGAYGSF